METFTMHEIRKAHRAATIKKVIKITRGDNAENKTKTFERISDISLKAFARENEMIASVTAQHKKANKARSEKSMLATRAATQVKRDARHKRASKGKSAATTVVAAK